MNLTIELEQETDGRWIAEIDALNGVFVYGEIREDAIRKVKNSGFSCDCQPFGKWRKSF